jgi:hypothetical protein
MVYDWAKVDLITTLRSQLPVQISRAMYVEEACRDRLQGKKHVDTGYEWRR